MKFLNEIFIFFRINRRTKGNLQKFLTHSNSGKNNNISEQIEKDDELQNNQKDLQKQKETLQQNLK